MIWGLGVRSGIRGSGSEIQGLGFQKLRGHGLRVWGFRVSGVQGLVNP